GNSIGTDVSGTHALGNGDGVLITGGLNNTVGGTTAGTGNLLSGNQRSGVAIVGDGSTTGGGDWIQGNYIGIDATGSTVLGNNLGIYDISRGGNVIGGAEPGALNVISGNTSFGFYFHGTHNTRVQGNYIGTDSTGTLALGNSTGVRIDDGSDNTIGG